GGGNLTGGPFSSGGNLSNASTIVGDVEAGGMYSSSGTSLGYVQSGVGAKTMPGNAAWTTLSAIATTIPWASTGGHLDKQVLTAGLDTIATVTHGSGVYAISVPALGTLTIHHSRFQATLLISLGASAKLVIKDENLWDPADATKPALLVQGDLLSSVSIAGGAATLGEASGSNFNPAGAPYNGVTDADTTDSYPSELHGIIHIMSAATAVTLDTKLVCTGSVIVAGDATIKTDCTISGNPSLKSAPPQGYTDAGAFKMSPVAGSYRWEVADVNP
ncbi:MAG TPA: hypothetical protein VHC70_11710, partial [Phycisphaerales bacterium]|nr:hypothetical protein [Phycisphaerales bacterium]